MYHSAEEWIADGGLGVKADARFHFGLLPMPYIGDLENARVVLLLLNPGLGPGDYHAENEVGGVRDRMIRTIRQELGDEPYPFQFLDPRLAWTGGFQWWYRRFQGVIAALAKRQGATDHGAARRQVARHIAALQLVPYHSQVFDVKNAVVQETPSSVLAIRYAQEVLADRAARGKTLVLVMRKWRVWELEPSTHVIDATSGARGAHIPKEAQERIVQMLEP